MIDLQSRVGATYHVECRRADGSLKWVEDVKNLVPTQGLNAIIDTYYAGASHIRESFLGLMHGPATLAASDTLEAFGQDWNETGTYLNSSTRPLFVAVASGQSLTNAASPVVYTTWGTQRTISGIFLTSGVLKLGPGILYSEVLLSETREVETDEVLSVVVTLALTST